MPLVETYIRRQVQMGHPLLAILFDPEKEVSDADIRLRLQPADLVFVGGSSATRSMTEQLVQRLKSMTRLPIIIFPGHPEQCTPAADAVLYLSLLSSRNPDVLIGQHIDSARAIHKMPIETIPMGYILVDGGTQSSVARVTQSQPISQEHIDLIVRTAIAGCLLGKRLVYLEAGSGARQPVRKEVIAAVRAEIDVPLIVGGGISTPEQMRQAFQAGADIVVIGNHLECFPQDAPLFGKKES